MNTASPPASERSVWFILVNVTKEESDFFFSKMCETIAVILG